MSYTHILVAVDFELKNTFLIQKAILIAKPYNTKISLLHVNINYSNFYTGVMNLDINDMQENIAKNSQHIMTKLANNVNYPITNLLCYNGEFGQILEDTIKKYNIDLVLCGHHKDFWSKLMSSARQLINIINIDMLIVPII